MEGMSEWFVVVYQGCVCGLKRQFVLLCRVSSFSLVLQKWYCLCCVLLVLCMMFCIRKVDVVGVEKKVCCLVLCSECISRKLLLGQFMQIVDISGLVIRLMEKVVMCVRCLLSCVVCVIGLKVSWCSVVMVGLMMWCECLVMMCLVFLVECLVMFSSIWCVFYQFMEISIMVSRIMFVIIRVEMLKCIGKLGMVVLLLDGLNKGCLGRGIEYVVIG